MGKIRRRAGAVGRRWGEGESWGGLMAGFDGWMDWKGRKGKENGKGKSEKAQTKRMNESRKEQVDR